MPDPVRRDSPDDPSRKLQDLLAESANTEPVDPVALLERIRLGQKAFGHIDVDDETIRELRDAGRR